MPSTQRIETTIPLTLVRVKQQPEKKILKKKKVLEKVNPALLTFGEKSVTLFTGETVEKYDFLQSTNEAIKLAHKYIDKDPALIEDPEYFAFEKLIKTTRDHFFSEKKSMNCLCVRHIERALDILEESLLRLKNI